MLNTLFGQDADEPTADKGVNLDNYQVILDFLCPEWDILIEIQAALRELPGVRLQYVAGHQDRKQDYTTLPLLAQLNVDADRIAGDYHNLHHPHTPFAHLSPNSRDHPVFPHGTVTKKIR